MRYASHIKDIEISGIRKCFEGAGPDCINLSIGQPDFDTPKHIKDAAISAISLGLCGYTPNLGLPDLVAAIREKFKRENGLSYASGEIMVTSGASEALFLAIASVCNPSDEVIMGDPSFLSYKTLAQVVGAKPVWCPLSDELRLSPDDVAGRITQRTSAIIVNSPGNPTGAVQSREELHALADLATDKGIALISDEVYEHFIYDGVHVSPAEFSDNVITINAVSKTYAMTGWRLGYLGARMEAVENMLRIHQSVQACASSISQAAAIAAITGPQDCVSQMRDEFKRRRDIIADGLSSMGIDLVMPRGAFYVFPQVGDGDAVAAKLVKAGVITVPGSAFGPGGKKHIRISYASSEDSIRAALKRMRNAL